jgi:hypothetical protein
LTSNFIYKNMQEQLTKKMLGGVLLSLATLVFGFGMGVFFGVNEDAMKGNLKEKGMAVIETVYGGDEAKLEGVLSKSWTYYKRAHLHANGLGTTALVLILLLAMIGGNERAKVITAWMLGVGALAYSLFWFFAGTAAPALGGTGAAKEAYNWLGMPGAALCLSGLLMTVALTVLNATRKKQV